MSTIKIRTVAWRIFNIIPRIKKILNENKRAKNTGTSFRTSNNQNIYALK